MSIAETNISIEVANVLRFAAENDAYILVINIVTTLIKTMIEIRLRNGYYQGFGH